MTGNRFNADSVIECINNGMTTAAIAAFVGVCDATIRKFAKSAGLKINRKKPEPKESVFRSEQIKAMYVQGITLEAIGQKFNITRERVRQILRKIDVSRESGGSTLRDEVKRDRKRKSIDAKYLAAHGVTKERYNEIRSTGILKSYREQKRNAFNRGIGFNLNLEQWFSIWTTSGKLEHRGRGHGKYVMSRINDAGSYEIGNVYIQLADENNREGVNIVRARGRVNADIGIYFLYPGANKPWVAKCGKKYVGMYATREIAIANRNDFISSNQIDNKSKGWSYCKGSRKPYRMSCAGVPYEYYETAEEAHSAYLIAVARKRDHLNRKAA